MNEPLVIAMGQFGGGGKAGTHFRGLGEGWWVTSYQLSSLYHLSAIRHSTFDILGHD